MKRWLWILPVVLGASLLTAQDRAAQDRSSRAVEWPYYAGDSGGTRHSTLTDINAGNVQQLQPAWQWKHWETPLKEYDTVPGQFEATPLMIDGTLYVTTPYNSIAALDAETGKERWRFDGAAYELGQVLSGSGWKLRGTAVWRDGGRLRIFLNSRHRLFMLDAQTGKPVASFGNNGQVSLTDGLARMSDIRHATQSSPPVVYGDLVIVGSQVPDRVQLPDPMGYVQAFNARTGKRVWTFATIPMSAKDPGAETWENESWRRNGHANVWAPMALDEKRGLLYLPTSTPTSDYYGGQRPGANLFAESLVCLDAATGKIKWHFQTVHHGLWDWDIPTQPNLVTITVNGKQIDAVAQVTKRGDTFVFDRVTGTPVWPIVERPVPTDSDVPGEKPYPTQPFPTKPASFVDQGVSLDDANNLTPEIRKLAQEQMQKFRIGPIFTPPSLRGTLQRPSQGGGANWGGAAFDPDTGYLIVRANNVIGVNRVGKNDGSESARRRRLLERLRGRWRERDAAGRPAADLAAVCDPGGDRSEQGRDRVEGAARRRQCGDSQSPAAEGRCAAGAARVHGQHGWRDGDQERAHLPRRRRRLHLRVRDQDRQGSLAGEDPVWRIRQSDDLSHRVGQAVHRHGDGNRRRQRARRVFREVGRIGGVR